ncbi:MAG TPA: hypothetical protein VFT41_10835 [Gemmatimonadaceae bacterium]|nr:hypothetical protein [Gemmatimonadaceae bacterium]
MTVRAVTLLVFNRPEQTRQVFERVRAARPTHLFVFADGLRSAADRASCEAARRAATDVDWPCEVQTHVSDTNAGARHAMARALAWAFEHVESTIVLEDDCLASPEFFAFAWGLLERFRDDARVLHISGESYYPAATTSAHSYYFSKYPLAWGWATWRRAWANYAESLPRMRGLLTSGAAEGFYDSPEEREYWTGVLRGVVDGTGFCWDYAWQFSCWLHGGLSVHPRVNLVSNIGWGPEGTHTRGASPLANRPVGILGPLTHPLTPVRDPDADAAIFDTRYPGAYLRRRKTLAYRLTLPARLLKRRLFPPSE